MRFRVFFGLFVLAALCTGEEKDKKKKLTPAEIVIPDPGTPIEDPAVAKQEVARFNEAMKAAGDAAEQARLVERLGRWDHAAVLKAVSKLLKHKESAVAIAAATACARQAGNAPKAGAALYKTLGREKREDVACAVIVGMGRIGYAKKSAQAVIEKIFRKETEERHKAAARYFGYIKAKGAFRMLAERLDKPEMSRPSGDKRVMPTSHWQKIWEDWDAAKPHVQWALSQLVLGETFETMSEARDWARAEGKKHGIKW